MIPDPLAHSLLVVVPARRVDKTHAAVAQRVGDELGRHLPLQPGRAACHGRRGGGRTEIGGEML